MASSSDFFHPEKVQQRQAASKAAFVDGVLQKVHSSLHPYLRNKWQELHDTVNEPTANLWLRQYRDSLRTIPFSPDLSADDDELGRLSKVRADEMKQVYAKARVGFSGGTITASQNGDGDFQFLAGLCGKDEFDQIGIKRLSLKISRVAGKSEESSAAALINHATDKYSATVNAKHLEGAVLRLTDADFWRRNLKVNQVRALEHERISFGMVGKSAACYVSDEQLQRYRSQCQRNSQMLENTLAVNDLGDEFTLSDLVAKSVSNPEIQIAEIMCRVSGIEEIARNLGYVGLFLTVTCPSKFHSQKLDKTGKYSFQNINYDGSSPRDAQDYLRDTWSLLRAALSDQNVDFFGIRVAEPHHDACPHWHLLLFVPRRKRGLTVRLFRRYFRRMDKHEPMAWKHRFTVKDIDFNKGSAAGYLIKYLCKNVNGQGMTDSQGLLDEDFDSGLDVVNSALRVKAWASCWGIRQFQFVGAAPVGVWRELRRIDGLTNDEFTAAADAADSNNWAEFTRIMQIDRKVLLKKDCGLNKYREPVQKVKGLIDVGTGDSIITREREWELIFGGGSVFDLPRNIFNNCRNDEVIKLVDKKYELEVALTHKLAVENKSKPARTNFFLKNSINPIYSLMRQSMTGVT
ncbi:replication endonuclease [Iodobacter sp. CM08]|uniref:replication endonuclease n=1 Tax=Iodobacter sp. CM08 TaxID=3085902 RepID=UPI0029821BC8|nr:replication endonuclease [Iodobacter sp. CM08]MDW5415649.1 replication endonuclease [Iodobacter sp. CM08]